MLKKIVLATHNVGKLNELKALLKDHNIELYSLMDFKEAPDVIEDGLSFADNAIKKAETIRDFLNMATIADDSGLMVDALDGEPGIYSARFAGEEKNDQKNNEKLLHLLEGIEPSKRTARFVSVLALAIPGEETRIVSGELQGIIASEPRGTNGFGYDPLFYLPDDKKTMAEISAEQKNKISHRAIAFQRLIKVILAK